MATCPAGHASSATDYCDVCGERIGGVPDAVPSSPGAGPAPAAAPAPSGGTPCPDCGTPATDRFCEECGYDFATGGGLPTPDPPTPASGPGPGPGTGTGTGTAEQPDTAGSGPRTTGRHSTGQYGTGAYSTGQYSTGQYSTGPSGSGPQGAGGAANTGWVAVITADRAYYDAIVAELEPDAGVIAFPPYCPERRVPLRGGQIRIGRRSASRGVTPEIDLRVPPEDPGVSHIHAVLLARPGGSWALVDPGSTNGTCLNGSTSTIPVNVEVPVGDGDRIHVGVWTTITLRKGEAS